jgi:repressor LexA
MAMTSHIMGLTSAQTRMFRHIVRYQAKHGYPPSRRDLAAAIGSESVNASSSHLAALEREGWIALDGGRARGIRILRMPPEWEVRGICEHCGGTGVAE